MNSSEVLGQIKHLVHSLAENATSGGQESLVTKFASKLPPPDKMYVWDPSQLIFDESKLKDAIDCMENPAQAAGNFIGHLLPGLLILLGNMYLAWVIFSRYYKSIAPGSKYKFYGLPSGLALPNGWPLAWLILALYVPYLTATGLINRHNEVIELPTWYARVFDYFTTNTHFSMIGSFGWGMVCDLLETKKRFSLPRRLSGVVFTWAYMAIALTIFFHARAPKCEYSGILHEAFILLPAIFATVSTALLVANPSSFFLANCAIFGGACVGIGFMADGFLLFPVPMPGGARYLFDSQPVSSRMHDVPGQFLLTITYFVFIYTSFFVLFGLLRGNRLGVRNPEYRYYGDYVEDKADEGQGFVDGADEEVTIYSNYRKLGEEFKDSCTPLLKPAEA